MSGQSRIILNVSGTKYEVTRSVLSKHLSTRLGKLVIYQNCGNQEEYYFERPIIPFEAILTYYQTGQLHLPPTVCPNVFKEELKFWEIDDDKMEECCRLNYIQFMETCKSKAAFRNSVEDRHRPTDNASSSLKNRVWNIIDYRESSWSAKTILCIGVAFVFLSVVTVALSSLPKNKRQLTPCEWSEYIGLSDSVDQTATEFFSKHDCHSLELDEEGGQISFKHPEEREGKDKPTTFNPDPTMNSNESSRAIKMSLPNINVKNDIFFYIDFFTTAYFTVELFIRLLVCPCWKSYFSNLLNVVDIFVLIGAFVEIIILNMKTQIKFSATLGYVIDSLKLLRALRLLRYCQHLAAVQVLRFSIRQNVKDLFVLLVHICIVLLIFANFLYIVEDHSNIDSIPQGWWLGLVTITTVGYGDYSPKTLGGKLACSACALCGIIMLSLIIPIFVDTFVQLYGIAHIPAVKSKSKENQSQQIDFTEVKKIDLTKENEGFSS